MKKLLVPGMPPKQGLYDPSFEKDGCGIGFVVQINGKRSHAIVQQGLEILANLEHRGAQGADPLTGDGAGILVQIPDEFFSKTFKKTKIKLPKKGEYAVGMIFLPKNTKSQKRCVAILEKNIKKEGFKLLGWRDVPVVSSETGEVARSTEPCIRQVFVKRGRVKAAEFERKLYVVRKLTENQIRESAIDDRNYFYVCSFSSQTLIYKGLLIPKQVPKYFTDLNDPSFKSALALVHSRFSTNTFPTWPLAHPYRFICHNGEINTVKGNVNWMRARQGRLRSKLFGDKLSDLYPIVPEGQSDSACLDNTLEFLVMGGRSLAHSMMMLIPEPWVANPQMDLERRGFYEFHSAMMEPWDGPAAVCFTDGVQIGATLDRNGLRPCRYIVTKDGRAILSSEAGVLPIGADQILEKGRLHPGRMFLVDTKQKRIVSDEEIKTQISRSKPYRLWVNQNRVSLEDLPEPLNVPQPDHATIRQRQLAFGYTVEEIKMVLTPMAVQGEEPTSSMGNDTPLAVLSDQSQLLFKYFRQLFAQVTNPPIDPIREYLVMSLATNIGAKPNLLNENPEDWRRIRVQQPILTNAELAKMKTIDDPFFRTKTLSTLFEAKRGPTGMREAVARLSRQASQAISEGCRFIILSDRGVNEQMAPIPSLLAVSSVHHHLVRRSKRAEVGLIVESGEPRDVHHFACLIGYGAGSINPYLAFETLTDMARDRYLPDEVDAKTAHAKYVAAINKGLLKIFSKMGISTVQSYCGAQIFEALGLNSEFVDRYFSGTPSRIGGLGLEEVARETLARHKRAYAPAPVRMLEFGGDIHYRVQGEKHSWNPETISKLQMATRTGDPKTFKEFSRLANEEAQNSSTLRGLIEIRSKNKPISISEVEPVESIVKRFTTGAMSFGALSKEAHETLAIAMNRIGAKSNSGEGGEDSARFIPLSNGDNKSSAIKQIASARFGVTMNYLVHAKELQIKMAQGAKPGEGGQLPGYKVDEVIAKMRHSTPGVTLISPPPHHDIYSIEDLKQLIFDLKNANLKADVSVKLVSEAGVGTVAAGVAKARADKILISGDSGGTGASPLSSIKYAGVPWELGLAETQQTLVLNRLRDRVRIEVDGQLKTGRDVVIGALLGAEEFGFSTAPLIVEGCIMMRKCHLNTCPVGVATQDAELRARFTGQPEHVINYFFFVAEEVREFMASMGVRRFEDLIGRVDFLNSKKAIKHWKAKNVNVSALLFDTKKIEGVERRWQKKQDHHLLQILDRRLVQECEPALSQGHPVSLELPIRNVNRTTGTLLSSELVQKHGEKGLPADTVQIHFKGSAGQSFGAFLAPGITLKLEGESNDYAGKGLSGGKIVVVPPKNAAFSAENSILIGNTSLYGATSGEAYFRGVAGERFAVRNSGAWSVVEGTGDHGCEYMTGGVVAVLGNTGRNFAAGMSGGIAYVFDEEGRFESKCNLGMVELDRPKNAEDLTLLKKLLVEHVRLTGSDTADRILKDWDNLIEKFVRVMPVDYRRALEEGRARHPGESV